MRCLVDVLCHRPLSVRFSLFNPPDAPEFQLVPRTLLPVGLFVTIEVFDQSGRRMYRSERPKQKLKLRPEAADSYLPLEPGYSFGAVLTLALDDLDLKPGQYRLSASYTNGVFAGPESSPIGSLSCSCAQQFAVA